MTDGPAPETTRDDRGIVILGFPRSGTTLLRRLLDAHPRIACPPETGVFSAAARFLREEPIAGGVRVGVLAGLGQIGVPAAQVRGRLADLAVGFLADHARASGKARWAEKHPYDVFHIDRIEPLLGDRAVYLAIVRDPFDALVSARELVDATGRYLDVFGEAIARDPRPLHALASLWAQSTASILDLRDRRPQDVQVLRYEDLVADPIATMRSTFAALHEDTPAGLVDQALGPAGTVGLGDWRTWSRSSIDASSVGRGRAAIGPAVAAELAEVLGPGLRAFGYSVPEGRVPGPEEAIRRHQLAMMMHRMRKDGPTR